MKRLLPLLILGILACQWSGAASPVISTPYPAEYIPTVVALTAAALGTTPAPTLTPTVVQPTLTPTVTLTPAPYQQYTIDYLRQRSYGGGHIVIVITI